MHDMKDRVDQTLRVLASDVDAQVQFLRSIGLTGELLDELALDFAYDAEVLIAQGEISLERAGALRAIDQHLSEMSAGSPEVWEAESARDSDSWRKLRLLAAEALATP